MRILNFKCYNKLLRLRFSYIVFLVKKETQTKKQTKQKKTKNKYGEFSTKSKLK